MEQILTLGTENPDITVGEILEKIAITSDERNGKPPVTEPSKKDKIKDKITLAKSVLKTFVTLIKASLS